ncbi:MAG: GNAT family N-acetyltransferase [Pyrinomonadaceae bacterium]
MNKVIPNKEYPEPVVRAVPYDERLLELSWSWLQDEEIRRLTMTPQFTKQEQITWFEGLRDRNDYLIWGIEAYGTLIGAFGIKGIDGESGEYWGYIGDKRFWGRGIGKWIVSEAIERAKEIGLKRLYLKVAEENSRAISLYQKFRFKMRIRKDHTLWMDYHI